MLYTLKVQLIQLRHKAKRVIGRLFTKESGIPANERATVIASMRGKFFVRIPEEGLLLKDLPGYNENHVYFARGQIVEGDFRIFRGDVVFTAMPHDNGC